MNWDSSRHVCFTPISKCQDGYNAGDRSASLGFLRTKTPRLPPLVAGVLGLHLRQPRQFESLKKRDKLKVQFPRISN